MAYTKTTWVEPQGSYLNRFKKQNETDTSVELIQDPVLTNTPTPFSVENMNKMEQGIYDAHQGIDSHLEQEPFGYLVSFEFHPTALQLATWRCLPLQGQIIQISMYQRLCDMMYVGDAANAAAGWWYKAADPGGTVRDVNGAYMRVLDHMGLFSRAAGQNSLYKMANNTPYDGMSIGVYLGDAIRNITGYIGYLPEAGGQQNDAIYDDETYHGSIQVGPSYNVPTYGAALNASLQVPVALENRPASISAYICIKY
jgi:hypothetical protein